MGKVFVEASRYCPGKAHLPFFTTYDHDRTITTTNTLYFAEFTVSSAPVSSQTIFVPEFSSHPSEALLYTIWYRRLIVKQSTSVSHLDSLPEPLLRFDHTPGQSTAKCHVSFSTLTTVTDIRSCLNRKTDTSTSSSSTIPLTPFAQNHVLKPTKPSSHPKLPSPKMCQLLVVHYKGCEHPDHLPGKLHEMPIYCANIEFIEAGVSSTHDVCQMCRSTAKGEGKAGSKAAEGSKNGEGNSKEKLE
jgi:hypothetical protein